MIDVFISYKRDERKRAERLAKKLQALGMDVWFDARIPSGATFDSEIERALRTAKAVLVLWTPASASSEWVRNEAAVGKERGVLAALMLAPCELPIAFRSTQYEPLLDEHFDDDNPAWLKTVERLKDWIGNRNEVEGKQRRLLRSKKVRRILGWVFAWPAVAALILLALSYLFKPLEVVRPGIYSFSGEQWDTGSVYALGSIDLEGDRLPVNHVEISCRRSDGVCLEARAELRDGELSVFTDRRQIDRWDDSIIVARSESSCADVIMTIDRNLRTVNTVRQRRAATSLNRDAEDMLCSWMNQRNSYRLVDGVARRNAEENGRAPYYMAALLAAIGAWTLFVLVRIISAFRR